jgi:cytochrome c oxidase subunit 2
MHIPVGEVVNLNLKSKDVIHSFWIPKLAGKVDMVPNNPNTMWMQADKPDVYLGQCAEFCGTVHALMRFRVVAESLSDFDAWLSSEAEPSITPADPLALQGQEIFEGSGECWACHTVLGSKKAKGVKGPSLTHFARRTHISAGIMENTQENLRAWLTDPDKVKPGNIMATDAAVYNDPAKRLKESEISALVSYLGSLE